MPVKDLLLAVDQLVNTLIGGRADESLSARSWRLREKDWKWATARKVIDKIFFWEHNHCYNSYVSELNKMQLPSEYRKNGS